MPQSHPASPASPQSPQQKQRLSPRSPESLTQGEVFESQYPNIVTTDSTEPAHPRTLHLKPVTWESLAELHLPCSERFEIIDGLLVWIPMANGTPKHQRIANALVSLFLSQLTWYAMSAADVEVESASNSSDSINTRIPDVCLTRRRPGSPSESSASSSQESPQKLVRFKKTRPPYAVIEVTSPSTRFSDLTVKWIQYCKTAIKFYYIIDLHAFETSGVARVIVGSKERRSGWVRCQNGDPDGAGSSSGPSTRSSRASYYKKVYTGDDRVNVGVFEQSPLTPSELVSFTFLSRKVDRIKQEIENKDRQNEELSRHLENKDRQNEELSRHLENKDRHLENKDRQIAELKAKLGRTQESSSKSKPNPTRTKQKDQSGRSSHRHSSESQPASPTDSPERKRHKQKK